MVHQYGIEALDCLQEGNQFKAVEFFRKMENASIQVMNSLDELSKSFD